MQVDVGSVDQEAELRSGCQPAMLRLLENFKDFYYVPHGWVSVVLCSLGVLTNAMNIVVLTRPRMINGVNLLLSCIALCDGALMTSQLVVAIYSRILYPSECRSIERYQYSWILFFIIHSHFGVWAHATSLWLAVVLSCTRYFTLKSKKTSICNQSGFTLILSLVVGVVCIVISTPMFLLYEVVPFRAPSDIGIWHCCYQRLVQPPIESPILGNCTEGVRNSTNGNFTTLYAQNRSRFYTKTLLRLIFWTMGILHKSAPCALLLVFVILLIRILIQVDRRRQRLLSVRTVGGGRRRPGILNRMQSMVSVRGSVNFGNTAGDRTTAMLIMVVSIFILCELPQGILYVLMAIVGEDSVFAHLYFFLGDLIDTLSILNSSVNFVLYCLMSAKFRTVFVETFGWRRLRPNVTLGLRMFHRNAAIIEVPSRVHQKISFEPRSILVRHSGQPSQMDGLPRRKCNSAPTSPPYCNDHVNIELIIEAEDSALL